TSADDAPKGYSSSRRDRAPVLTSTSLLTRSGCVAANRMAIGPVSYAAMTAARREPTASSAAPTSSAQSSHVGGVPRRIGSDTPVQGRTKPTYGPMEARLL